MTEQSVISGPAVTVREFIDAMNRGDIATVSSLFAADATWTVCASGIPGAGTAPAAAVLENVFPALAALFESGPQVEVLRTVTQDDWVVVEALGRGKLRSGEDYRNQYTHWYQVAEGKVTALREYMDTQYAATVFAPPGADS
ncbi:nuclear transport factor 2 family protein [Streptomyces sp. NPDC002143]